MKTTKYITEIRSILNEVDDILDDEAQQAAVECYWQVGKLICEYKKQTGKNLREIADEIGLKLWAPKLYSRFYKLFKDGYPKKFGDKVVNWTMFKVVLSVRDAKSREFYLRQACKHGWNKYELLQHIRDGYCDDQQQNGAESRGHLRNKKQRLYTYAAEVIKVVDGDTLDVEVDLGLKIKQEQRLRLRGVDTPEVLTKKGDQARTFVMRELDDCVVKQPDYKGRLADRPLVVVTTYKSGKFGRYIADVYYLKGETDAEVIAEKGKLLNQELLDQGLSRKVE